MNTTQVDLLPYEEMAAQFGLDISNPRHAEDIITSIRFLAAKFSAPRLRDEDVCNQVGITMAQMARLKNSRFTKLATKIVLAEFLRSDARQSVQQMLFSTYQNFSGAAFENMARIASAQMKPDANGKTPPMPSYKDQIGAFEALYDNPVAQAWLANTFLGDQVVLDEDEYLTMRARFQERVTILDLDESHEARPANPPAGLPAPVDGTPPSMPAPAGDDSSSPPATSSPSAEAAPARATTPSRKARPSPASKPGGSG